MKAINIWATTRSWSIPASMMILGHIFWMPGALADRVPGTAYSGRNYYFSTKMDPIKVSFWPGWQLREGLQPGMDPLVQAEIPRAYIFYTQQRYGAIPREIDVFEIGVMFVYPDGRPYSVALRSMDSSDLTRGKRPEDELRGVRYVAIISGTRNSAEALAHMKAPVDEHGNVDKYHEYIGNEFGLDVYKWATKNKYFGDKDDKFKGISCFESNNKNSFCAYYMVLGKNFIAKVHFLDFRFHGGRDFANERTRVFKQVICKYLNCLDEEQ